MKFIGIGVCILTASSLVGAQHPGAAVDSPLPRMVSGQAVAFVNVTLIPMDRERFLAHQTVIVENGVITAMGVSGSVKVPEGAARIEGRGRFLMPGLADMHVHVSERHLLLYVANGVTTIRNMGGSPEMLAMRQRIADGQLLGPRVFTAGPLTAGTPQRFSFSVVVKTPAEAEQAVAEQKKAGYDFVKAYEGLTAETYAALVKAAEKQGLRVAGHIPEDAGLAAVLQAKQASLEHAEQIDYRFFEQDMDVARIPTVVKMIRDAGVRICPTLAVYENFARQAKDLDGMVNRPEMKYVTPATRQLWLQIRNRAGSYDEMRTFFHRKMIQQMQQAGVPLLAGTDNPNPMMVPGFSLHDELQALVDAGLTPFEAIVAATRNAGEFLRGNFGTVRAGNQADFILLSSNPLMDIGALKHRAGVMVRGQWFSQEELDARLESLAAATPK